MAVDVLRVVGVHICRMGWALIMAGFFFFLVKSGREIEIG
jgi:hypothetical protein